MSISEVQLLNIVLSDKDISVLRDNLINKEHFTEAIKEYEFIDSFYNDFGCVPDKETFIAKFPDFKLFKVEENVSAVIDRVREEDLFRKSVAVFNKASEIISVDSNRVFSI